MGRQRYVRLVFKGGAVLEFRCNAFELIYPEGKGLDPSKATGYSATFDSSGGEPVVFDLNVHELACVFVS